MTQKTALIAGASGLTGNALLSILLASDTYKTIVVLTRRKLTINHPKIVEVVADFDKLSDFAEQMQADDVFCCLGTTIKKAKSKEAFKKVDWQYPIELAKITKSLNAKQFMVISSIGANATSLIFYSKIKGMMEADLKIIGFECLHIFRPSLLLGKRKEFRFGEYMGTLFFKMISWLFIGNLKKYKGIKAEVVANAMFKTAQNKNQGINIYSSDEIGHLA